MDIETVILTVLTLSLGYLLSELSSARKRRADLKIRWDDERRRVYSRYLAHADAYHRILRDLKGIERRLNDPEGATADIAPDDIRAEDFRKLMREMVETGTRAREDLWARRKDTREQLKELGAEIDILGTYRTQAFFVLLSIDAEDIRKPERPSFGMSERSFVCQTTRRKPLRWLYSSAGGSSWLLDRFSYQQCHRHNATHSSTRRPQVVAHRKSRLWKYLRDPVDCGRIITVTSVSPSRAHRATGCDGTGRNAK